MVRNLSAFAALFVLGFGSASAETPVGEKLPEGAGRDLLVRVCSACHAPENVIDQRLDRAGWEDLVAMMAGRGVVATDAELKQIVDYLAAHFPQEQKPGPSAHLEAK